MNNNWDEINAIKAKNYCKNLFKVPSKSNNQVWMKKKSNKNYTIKCEFQYNDLVYKAFCKEIKNEIEEIDEYKNEWIRIEKYKLYNWGYSDFECTVYTSVEYDGIITTKAIWYDPYYKIKYSIVVKHKEDENPHIISVIENMKDNSPRVFSNDRNIIFIVSGIVYLLLGILNIVVIFKRYDFFHLSSLATVYICILGVYMLAYGLNKYDEIKEKNNRLKSLPYLLDFEKELESYTYIGTNKKKFKENGTVFRNYLGWKSYIKNRYQTHISQANKENFYHFLFKEYRYCIKYSDIIKTVAAPAFFAVFPTIYGDDTIIMGIIIMSIIIVVVTKEIADANKKCDFISDIVKILYDDNKTTMDEINIKDNEGFYDFSN